jgi:kynureninase
MSDHPTKLAEIREMDRNDPLRELRGRFSLPPDTAYFDGHSLGPLPTAALARTSEVRGA